jgi:hypothetical protein
MDGAGTLAWRLLLNEPDDRGGSKADPARVSGTTASGLVRAPAAIVLNGLHRCRPSSFPVAVTPKAGLGRGQALRYSSSVARSARSRAVSLALLIG